MRDMSKENEITYSSSSSSSHLHRSSLLSTTGACNLAEQDDFSLFLHQILLRSSSASANQMSNSVSTQVRPQSPNLLSRSALISGSDRLVLDGIVAGDSSSAGLIFTGSGDYCPGNVSSSVEGIENNDLDEYDCESEEGLEALVEEATIKRGPGRSSSKRSRAAEVHNLSEKRRRSRINEKMKALQNLIPNSNKTDKASMLDEAIEYLKQLQLQVQMLSMRNGLRLLPMSPGILQPVHLSQTRTSFGEENGNGSFHMNMIDTLSANQEASTPNVFSLPNRHAPSNLPSVPNSSQIIDSETSFGLESSILADLGSFQLQSSSVGICKEDKLLHQQLDANHSDAYPLASLPFSIQASKRNHSTSMGSRILRQLPEGVLLDNMEQNQVLPSHLIGVHGRRCSMADDMKIERP